MIYRLLCIDVCIAILGLFHIFLWNCIRRANLQRHPDGGGHIFGHHRRLNCLCGTLTDGEHAMILGQHRRRFADALNDSLANGFVTDSLISILCSSTSAHPRRLFR
jgi:hypothetical protein